MTPDHTPPNMSADTGPQWRIESSVCGGEACRAEVDPEGAKGMPLLGQCQMCVGEADYKRKT